MVGPDPALRLEGVVVRLWWQLQCPNLAFAHLGVFDNLVGSTRF